MNELWIHTAEFGGRNSNQFLLNTVSGEKVEQNSTIACILTVITAFRLKKVMEILWTEERNERK